MLDGCGQYLEQPASAADAAGRYYHCSHNRGRCQAGGQEARRTVLTRLRPGGIPVVSILAIFSPTFRRLYASFQKATGEQGAVSPPPMDSGQLTLDQEYADTNSLNA